MCQNGQSDQDTPSASPLNNAAARLRLFTDGHDLSCRISRKKENVEAFVIQKVGDIALSRCGYC
jgi:hypothetical protein